MKAVIDDKERHGMNKEADHGSMGGDNRLDSNWRVPAIVLPVSDKGVEIVETRKQCRREGGSLNKTEGSVSDQRESCIRW